MPKYLVRSCYTDKGLKGLLKEGGTKRRKAVEQAAKAVNGTVDAMYYAFGDTDVYVTIHFAGGGADRDTPASKLRPLCG